METLPNSRMIKLEPQVIVVLYVVERNSFWGSPFAFHFKKW